MTHPAELEAAFHGNRFILFVLDELADEVISYRLPMRSAVNVALFRPPDRRITCVDGRCWHNA